MSVLPLKFNVSSMIFFTSNIFMHCNFPLEHLINEVIIIITINK